MLDTIGIKHNTHPKTLLSGIKAFNLLFIVEKLNAAKRKRKAKNTIRTRAAPDPS